MNLKKAFRYQNMFNKLFDQAIRLIKAESFLHSYAIHKKSELNKIALEKTYEDEIKNDSTFNTFEDTSYQKYDYEILYWGIVYLIKNKALLTEAIAKAKVKAKIQPISFETPITYDSAVALASTYRKYITSANFILPSIKENKAEKLVSTKIMVSAEQPPVDVYYTKESIVEVLEDKKKALTSNTEWAINFVEDLSDKIEAASLQAEVKFTTDIPITSSFNSFYQICLEKISTPTCDNK